MRVCVRSFVLVAGASCIRCLFIDVCACALADCLFDVCLCVRYLFVASTFDLVVFFVVVVCMVHAFFFVPILYTHSACCRFVCVRSIYREVHIIYIVALAQTVVMHAHSFKNLILTCLTFSKLPSPPLSILPFRLTPTYTPASP